jgi:hypothetical protein
LPRRLGIVVIVVGIAGIAIAGIAVDGRSAWRPTRWAGTERLTK